MRGVLWLWAVVLFCLNPACKHAGGMQPGIRILFAGAAKKNGITSVWLVLTAKRGICLVWGCGRLRSSVVYLRAWVALLWTDHQPVVWMCCCCCCRRVSRPSAEWPRGRSSPGLSAVPLRHGCALRCQSSSGRKHAGSTVAYADMAVVLDAAAHSLKTKPLMAAASGVTHSWKCPKPRTHAHEAC